MKTLGLILTCWDCYGADHVWHWHFPIFFLLMMVLMFIIFRRRRRGSNSCYWPGWRHYRHSGFFNAEEILKNRFAKGEISKEEFDKMKRDINK